MTSLGNVIHTTPDLVYFDSDADQGYARIGAFGEVADAFDAQRQAGAAEPGMFADIAAGTADPSFAGVGQPPDLGLPDLSPQEPSADLDLVAPEPPPGVNPEARTALSPEQRDLAQPALDEPGVDILAPAPDVTVGAPGAAPPLEQPPALPASAAESAEQYAAGAAREIQGVERAAIIEGETARALGDIYDRQIAEDAAAARAQAELLDLDRAALHRATTNYDQALRRFDAMHVDPRRWWTNAGEGGTVAAILGVALGGFGGALLNQPNDALAIIEGSIERTIRADMANMESARYGVAEARSMVGTAREIMRDDQSAAQAARSAAWGRIAQQAAALKARAGPLAASAEADRLVGTIEQRAAHELEVYRRGAQAEARAELAARRSAARAAGGGGGAGAGGAMPGVDPAAFAAMRAMGMTANQAYIALQAQAQATRELVVPGARVVDEAAARGLSAMDRAFVRTAVTTAATMGGAVAQMRSLRTKTEGGTIDTAARAAANGLRQSLIADYRKLFATGVPSEPEMVLFRSLVPNVSEYELPWENFAAQLTAAENMINDRAAGELRSRGYAIGEDRPRSARSRGQ